VREKFAQAKFYGAPWREAVNAALSEESTTATIPVSRASTAQLELCDVSDVGLSALLGRLPASYTCDRDLGTHKALRIDNSNLYNIALTVDGRVLQNIIVHTGCEMVVVGKTAARQAGIRPSMMRSGAVALRCADERVKQAFDHTIDPVSFVFNPGTENETIVMAQGRRCRRELGRGSVDCRHVGRVRLGSVSSIARPQASVVQCDVTGSVC
jgi:hypothetical protein